MSIISATVKPAAITALILGLAMPTLARGDDTRFEVTPFAAYRVGGTFDDTESDGQLKLSESNAWGLIVNGKVESNTEWEVLFTRQSTDIDTSGIPDPQPEFDIDIDYLHFGGTYLFDGERVRPFIALTIGATRFEPRVPGYDARTYASMSFGAGWKFRLAEHFGLRHAHRQQQPAVLRNRRRRRMPDRYRRPDCRAMGGPRRIFSTVLIRPGNSDRFLLAPLAVTVAAAPQTLVGFGVVLR